MKNNLQLFVISFFGLISCTKEGDTTLQPFNKIIFEENFSTAREDLPPTPFDISGWTTFAQAGTRNFTEQVFSGNGYAEFTSFNSNQAVNIAWLISPKIDMEKQDGEIITFTTAQSFLTSLENSCDLLVSTNFDGINVAAADWVVVPANVVSPFNPRFTPVFSGQVDLSKFKGQINFAFRVKGSGTNQNLDGTYQIDDIMVFHRVNEQN
jgi:hypothetical protein